MSVTAEAKTFHSATELANRLSVPDISRKIEVSSEQIEKFIREKGFPSRTVNGAEHLDHDALGEFFESFASSLGVSHKFYDLPNHLKNATSPWAATLVKMYGEKFNWPASIAPSQGELLRALVCNINPRCVVEIGCFTGISSVWMASGLEQLGGDGVIHSVDLFNEIMPGPHTHYRYLRDPLSYARQSAGEAGLSERVHFHKMNSREMGRRVGQTIKRPIDLIFIDGDHSIQGCFEDFFLFYPHIAVGGYIVLHDIYPERCGWDGPRYLIDSFIKNSPDFELIEIQTELNAEGVGNYGMAIIRKLGPRRAWSKRQKQTLLLRGSRDLGAASQQKVREKLSRNGKIAPENQTDFRQRLSNLATIRSSSQRKF